MSPDLKLFEELLHQAALGYKNGAGIQALAEHLGLRSGTFSNKCNPHMEGHTLNIRDMAGILHKTEDHRSLYELSRQFGYTLVPVGKLNNVSDVELLDTWAAWEAELGDTANTIRDALVDNRIDSNELRRITKEMIEDIQRELELLQRLASLSSEDNLSKLLEK